MISILKSNEKLTSFNFYSSFLKEVALHIKEYQEIGFKLVENGDERIFESEYKIDPITIPLILSLSEQLSKYYNKPIVLALFNNHATEHILNFLFKSDFFYLAGDNTNPHLPYGRNILHFETAYLGDFIKKDLRPEHKVRCYSLDENNLYERIQSYPSDDAKRDFLISEYIYAVREHFQELLFDNANTSENVDFFIEILSELITNGVLHSKSNTFALMFLNKYSTKFSISDNGIGFQQSMKSKKRNYLYEPSELKAILDDKKLLKVDNKILTNLNFIMETLYFSALKDRRGLFDLMISVVLYSNGYFRLHSDNTQIIISNRMRDELIQLNELRNELFRAHKSILIHKNTDDSINDRMILIKNQIRDCFVSFYCNICDKYNNDFKYSSIRFYTVRFKGVHIEVEIPTV